MFANLHQLSHHHAWRHQLEMLLESAGEGIYGIDLRGRCIFINQAGAALLGYSPDEVLGRNMHYLMHHSHGNGALMPVQDCRIFQAFREGRGVRVDNEVLWRRDGSAFAAEYASYPIRDDGQGDSVVGAVVTFRDISARKRTEAALQAAHDELELRVATRTAELEAASEALRHSNVALQRLSAHADRIREEERRSIARDIHDELGSSLTALQLGMNWLGAHLPDPGQREHIDEMLAVAGTAMNAVRRILNDLRPGVLDHLGLWAAVEALLKDFQRRNGARCVFDCPPGIEHARLGRDTEIALYRIVQEALTNVSRHARAQLVTLTVRATGRDLAITLQDDGCGMQVPAHPVSFGLLGMHERARALGGRFAIESLPGAGTTLCVTLPGALA
ncbi:PAS domain-containing sensor histidine kinase [Uliginosibacterium paludis]|uniref:PAS domain-containing sensor histidine kinase n=1 Tax=Uliginosibacterium paludis TaxID=1615952 RepID=A0ABV2CQX7_9RHOO